MTTGGRRLAARTRERKVVIRGWENEDAGRRERKNERKSLCFLPFFATERGGLAKNKQTTVRTKNRACGHKNSTPNHVKHETNSAECI